MIRKPHTKSKKGCIDCRRRRVKCSEDRPICRACVRREVPCHYPKTPQAPSSSTLASSPTSDSTGNFSGLSAASAPSPATVISSLSESPSTHHAKHFSSLLSSGHGSLELKDLALMHHWTVSTSLELFNDCRATTFWQVVFPQVGFEYPFVARAILSLAALHLGSIDTPKSKLYTLEATGHHRESLRGFQQAVSHISDDNSEALVIWSILNMIYVFAISRPQSDELGSTTSDRGSQKDRLLGLEWIPMARGVHAILGPTHDHLRFGRLKEQMDVGNWFDLQPDTVQSQVDDCFCRARDSWKESHEAETYEEALSILRRCRLFIDQFSSMDATTLSCWGFNRAWAGPLMFIYFAPEKFFVLLQQRQPAALILYAYFGALLHDLNCYWFLRGWGKGIIEVVDELLGGYWRPWISWPLEVVGLL